MNFRSERLNESLGEKDMIVFVLRIALGLIFMFTLRYDDFAASTPIDSDVFYYQNVPQMERCFYNVHPAHNNFLRSNVTTQQDSNVTFLGQWGVGPCYAAAAKGNYAYIGNGALFQVLDMSDPRDPQIVAETLVNGTIFDMDVSGHYAYVVGAHTLTIIDISTPTSPLLVKDLRIPAVCRVIVSGDYAYLGDFPGLLHIVHVSDPTDPHEVSTQMVSGEAVVGIGIYQHYAYVSTSDGMGMDIIDVSDPNNPQYEGYYETGGLGGDIAVDGHYLFLGTSRSPQFRILDITDPTNPEEIGGLETYGYNLPYGITVAGNYAYILRKDDGISVINVSDLSMPEEVGSVNYTGPNHIFPGRCAVRINSLEEKDNGEVHYTPGTLYVPAFLGLWIIDVSPPEDPTELAFFPTGESAEKMVLAEDIAYVADGDAGLWVVDVTNPVDPQNISHLATEGYLYDIALAGSYVYLLHSPVRGASTGSLWIVDISDPSDPSEMSRLSIGGNALAVSGDYAFATVEDSGLVIVNVSNPTNPYRVGSCPLSGHPYDVAVWGDYAYVATLSDGLRIIDVSEPSSPVEVSSYFEDGITTLAVTENFAYVPHSERLWVVDISVPTQPCVIGSTATLFYQSPIDITVSGDYVYMSFMADGVQVIKVSSPETPVLAGYFHRGWGRGRGVTVSGEHIYWGFRTNGFFILRNDLITQVHEQFDQDGPAVLRLHQNYPNPFNSRTRIKYYLHQDCLVKLAVYDVPGREVATLVDGFEKRGKHEVNFNANGFSSGVYVYRLQAGDFFQTKKMLLVR